MIYYFACHLSVGARCVIIGAADGICRPRQNRTHTSLLERWSARTSTIRIRPWYPLIGNCTVTTDPNPETAVFSGAVNGNTITGFVSDGQKQHNVTATVSGNTISGTVTGDFPGESNMFTVTRSSSGTPAPAIASFTANPSTISAGDSTTLSWSTINAARTL